MKRMVRTLCLGIALVSTCCSADLSAQEAGSASRTFAVAPQYDTTHVYVAPKDVDAFVKSFLGTFGGSSTKQVVVTVTPTPSSTTSQLLQTPAGTVSLFGFVTSIPVPFGTERNGYLVTDLPAAVVAARAAGADLLVTPFPDPIGIDALVQWPGGVNMQLYWHTKAPSYAAFAHIPENRIYVSEDRVAAFEKAFLQFSNGKVTSDDGDAPGVEIGKPGLTVHRIRIESTFGKMVIYTSDGHLSFPYGAETTGYEVDDLDATLAKARVLGAAVLVEPFLSGDRRSAIVKFPGGYIAEIHATYPKL
jgi:hypothetical protein